jgi:chemotaxis protein CheX
MSELNIATLPPSIVSDPAILNATLGAVENALTMADSQARCVGIMSVPPADPGVITGIIGVHGDVSGFITVNMAEKAAIATVNGLLQERFDSLGPQIVDGVGEITNIIAGGIKASLASTAWSFRHVTVPSVIIGQNYHIAYVRGLNYFAAMFEQTNSDAFVLSDRMFQVSVSLLRL